jgi:hypothetical protein
VVPERDDDGAGAGAVGGAATAAAPSGPHQAGDRVHM